MGKMQRNKGAGYEREVCDAFGAALGVKVTREIGQARDGGADIVQVEPLVIECKRRRTLGTVMGWLEQAMIAATNRMVDEYAKTGDEEKPAPTPIVVAREDAGESIVIMRLSDFLPLFVGAQNGGEPWNNGNYVVTAEETNVIDLMARLQESLAKNKKPAPVDHFSGSAWERGK